jgi:O-methyltransferase involved in polyketide biosynthesis
VPVDFEAGESRRDVLVSAGCDAGKPAIMVSTGVSIYLTRDANTATLREVAGFAQGSTLAMTFLLPLETADDEVRAGLEMAERGARASGTPFVSFFTPPEMLALARDAGFAEARHVPAVDLTQRYFAGRTDGLRPPRNAEELLVART